MRPVRAGMFHSSPTRATVPDAVSPPRDGCAGASDPVDRTLAICDIQGRWGPLLVHPAPQGTASQPDEPERLAPGRRRKPDTL